MDRPFGRLVANLKQRRTEIQKQQAEIKELKDKKNKLRVALAIIVAPKPFRFLALPAELREAIYELCFVKGTVFPAPRPIFDHRYKEFRPFEDSVWSLLAVNRQVREEAAKVLLSKNHFVLSSDIGSGGPFWAPLSNAQEPKWPRSLPVLVMNNLRSISIAMDLRYIANDVLTFASKARSDHVDRSGFTPDKQVLRAHGQFAEFTEDWATMCRFFVRMDFVEIDVTNAYCLLGCHRYIYLVAKAIESALQRRWIPNTLQILGTMNKTERCIIRDKVKSGLLEFLNENHDGRTLRFKSLPCPRDCLVLHQYDAEDDLEDEEITFKSLVSEASGESKQT